jgi:hypothetical protein
VRSELREKNIGIDFSQAAKAAVVEQVANRVGVVVLERAPRCTMISRRTSSPLTICMLILPIPLLNAIFLTVVAKQQEWYTLSWFRTW